MTTPHPATKQCPSCLAEIPWEAQTCMFCGQSNYNKQEAKATAAATIFVMTIGFVVVCGIFLLVLVIMPAIGSLFQSIFH